MNVIETPEIKSTCTEKGKTAGSYCVDCGVVISGEDLPLVDHDYVTYLYNGRNCQETSYSMKECRNCGYEEFGSYYGNGAKGPHIYDEDGKCTLCGEGEVFSVMYLMKSGSKYYEIPSFLYKAEGNYPKEYEKGQRFRLLPRL